MFPEYWASWLEKISRIKQRFVSERLQWYHVSFHMTQIASNSIKCLLPIVQVPNVFLTISRMGFRSFPRNRARLPATGIHFLVEGSPMTLIAIRKIVVAALSAYRILRSRVSIRWLSDRGCWEEDIESAIGTRGGIIGCPVVNPRERKCVSRMLWYSDL